MNRYLLVFILFIVSILPQKVEATHSMGADLTYTCLGNNTYLLRLTFYRDCYGIQAPITPWITISSVSCNYTTTVYLDTVPGTGQEITPICPSDTSTCNGGIFTGIQEWIYEGTVTLPYQCADWDFSYYLCCRNQAITTIQSPLSEDIYIHSTLNNLVDSCNNSPTFSNKPVPFVCLGQQFCFNHGATDVDGDSLVYSLITPLGGLSNGMPVTYLSPYSASQPLLSSPPMSFDPATGDFCATPQQIEVTVMAVLVQEYRNGVLIGEVERDMQITVIQCSNLLPELTGINGSNDFTATICAYEPFCFDIFSADADASQTVSISWDDGISGGTFNSNGAQHPTGNFCWTPTQQDVSPNPHCFTVRVWDDACPYYGSQVYSYCITVVNLSVGLGPDLSTACGGTVPVVPTIMGSPGNYTYLWSNGATTATQNLGPGVYTLTVSNDMCSASDAITINPLTGPLAAFTVQSQGCNTLANFTNLSTINSGNITGYEWDFGDGGTSSLQNPAHQYATPGNYTGCLVVDSDVGCTDTICQDITISIPPVADFTFNDACEDETVLFTNNSTAPTGNLTYSWNFDNGQQSNLADPSIIFPGAGTYNVVLIATDSSGCSDSSQQVVTIHQLPEAGFVTGIVQCQSGLVSLTDTSQGNIASWSWDFDNGLFSTQQNPSTNYNSPGTYDISLIVTTVEGCSDSFTVTQNINPGITVIASADQSICQGEGTAIFASGGNTYLWSDGQTSDTITVSPLVTTLYLVTVTDANGCTAVDSITVSVTIPPSLVITPDTTICAGDSIELTVSGAASYLWSNGATGSSVWIFPNGLTTLSVTGTSLQGCESIAFTTLNTANPVQASLVGGQICQGDSLLLDAGIPGLTYTWNTGAMSQSIYASVSGTYTVTVSDGGCTDTASAAVIVNPVPVVSAGADISLCEGDSVVLTATGALSYSWNNGAISSSITVSPASTTNYSVTGTGTGGCEATDDITVSIFAMPVVNLQAGMLCPGDTIILDAGNMGSSYTWSNGAATQTIAVTAGGTYSVTVSTPGGCSATGSALITEGGVTSAPVALSFCEGSQATLNAGNAGSQFVWSPGGQTGQVITVNQPGNYTVTITSPAGCTGTSTFTVTENSLPAANAGNDIFPCAGDSVVLSASGGTNYLWSNGQQSASITVAAPTVSSYIVTVTNANGCQNSDTVLITPVSQPVVSLPDPTICVGDSVLLDAGNPGCTYSWSNGITSQTIWASISGVYAVTVTRNGHCSASDQSLVTVGGQFTDNLQDVETCNGIPVSLNAGNAGNSFLWSTGATTQTVTAPVSGIYTVTVTDSLGCSGTFSAAVTIGGSIIPSISASDVCEGETVSFINSGDTASSSGTTSWSFGDGNTAQLNNTLHTYTNPGTFQVYLTITELNGCTGTDSLVLTVHPAPVAGFTAVGGCVGTPVTFQNTSLISSGTITAYQWAFGDSTVSNAASPSHIFLASGSYTNSLIAMSAFGCVDTTQAAIVVHNNPIANFNYLTTEGCGPLPVQFFDSSSGNGSQVISWLWNFGDGNFDSIPNPLHIYEEPGVYNVTLTVVTNENCMASEIIPGLVTLHPDPEASFVCNPILTNILQPVYFDNHTSGATQYQWDFGDESGSNAFDPSHVYTDSGFYQVTLLATNEFGCIDSAYGEIIMLPAHTLYLPNAFTPNSDGKNEVFSVSGIGIRSFTLMIFNRWGELIFKGDNCGWDGTVQSSGEPAKQDVYVYRLLLTDIFSEEHEREGRVSLIR